MEKVTEVPEVYSGGVMTHTVQARKVEKSKVCGWRRRKLGKHN